MPLKIMLYLSLFSPGKYTSCQEDFKYPDDDFFSFCVFSLSSGDTSPKPGSATARGIP